MKKIYIIYTKKYDPKIPMVKDVHDKITAEKEIDQILTAGGSVHKVFRGDELTITTKPRLVYPSGISDEDESET